MERERRQERKIGVADKSKILVVDDSREVREFFADSVLRPAGYHVQIAVDGHAGLRAAQDEHPDLIIADLQMPGLTGLELKRALNAAGDHTPMLLVTAEGSENIASEATLVGVAGYLPKPVDVDVMLAAVQQALTVERLRRERAEALLALERRVHQLETLQGIGRALTASLDLGQVLVYVVEAAARLTGADGARLYLLEAAKGQLALRAARAPGQGGSQAMQLACDDPVAQEVYRDGRALRWPPSTDGVKAGQPTTPALYVPLRLREQVIGILAAENLDRERPFAQADVGPLAILGDYAAIAVANARLFAEVQHQSITDGLTGLLNRRHFFTLAERELARSCRYKRPVSAIMLDIDHFKQVNDTYGHVAGDQALVEVARRCRTSIRTIDLLGRYGGEELAFILPETDAAGACRLAERLRQVVAAGPVETSSGALALTVSLGVAGMVPASGAGDVMELLNQADSALYAAKEAGRNLVVTK